MVGLTPEDFQTYGWLGVTVLAWAAFVVTVYWIFKQ